MSTDKPGSGDPPADSSAEPSAAGAASEAAGPEPIAGEVTETAASSGEAVPAAETVGARTEISSETATPGIEASSPWAVQSSDVGGDEPILPAAPFSEDSLREAVGARRKKRRKKADDQPFASKFKADDDDDDAPKQSRRMIVISALALIVGLGVAALVFLGRANAERYFITCSTEHVTAERGRSFPPWGSLPLGGAQWRAIALPANAECRARETESVAELEGWFLELLVERASTMLTDPHLLEAAAAPGAKSSANPLDLAASQLNQALLLSRAPERRDQRKDVERLLGDVQYWRASLRLRDASAALLDASKQFDAAAAQRPRHVTDAAAWGAFLRKLTDDLHAGPNGVVMPSATQPSGEHPNAPAGSALPVEEPAQASGSDTTPTPPDAGVPTGGVLL